MDTGAVRKGNTIDVSASIDRCLSMRKSLDGLAKDIAANIVDNVIKQGFPSDEIQQAAALLCTETGNRNQAVRSLLSKIATLLPQEESLVLRQLRADPRIRDFCGQHRSLYPVTYEGGILRSGDQKGHLYEERINLPPGVEMHLIDNVLVLTGKSGGDLLRGNLPSKPGIIMMYVGPRIWEDNTAMITYQFEGRKGDRRWVDASGDDSVTAIINRMILGLPADTAAGRIKDVIDRLSF
jgi:hypothetical protein